MNYIEKFRRGRAIRKMASGATFAEYTNPDGTKSIYSQDYSPDKKNYIQEFINKLKKGEDVSDIEGKMRDLYGNETTDSLKRSVRPEAAPVVPTPQVAPEDVSTPQTASASTPASTSQSTTSVVTLRPMSTKSDQYFIDKANKQSKELGLGITFKSLQHIKDFQQSLGLSGNQLDGNFGNTTRNAYLAKKKTNEEKGETKAGLVLSDVKQTTDFPVFKRPSLFVGNYEVPESTYNWLSKQGKNKKIITKTGNKYYIDQNGTIFWYDPQDQKYRQVKKQYGGNYNKNK